MRRRRRRTLHDCKIAARRVNVMLIRDLTKCKKNTMKKEKRGMGLLSTGREVTYMWKNKVNLREQETGDNNAAQQLELG